MAEGQENPSPPQPEHRPSRGLPMWRKIKERAMQFGTVSSQLQEEQQRRQHAEAQSITDELTGLPNRRGADQALQEEIARARRGGYAVTVGYADANRLRETNNTYGHRFGDLLIQAYANLNVKEKRETDVVAHPSGDEFIFILPHTDREGAKIWSEKRSQLFDSAVADLSEDVHVPLSMGIGTYTITPDLIASTKTQEEIQQLIKEALENADKAMYISKDQTKQEGKVIVRSFEELSKEELEKVEQEIAQEQNHPNQPEK